MDREQTQAGHADRDGEREQQAGHDQGESNVATAGSTMQIERTTTPDGRLLLLFTFEDADE